MSSTQHRRVPPAERDDRPAPGASLRDAVPDPARHGNDNLAQASTIDEFVRSRKRTWEIFVRWLMIGAFSERSPSLCCSPSSILGIRDPGSASCPRPPHFELLSRTV